MIRGKGLSKAYLGLLQDIGVEVNLLKSTSYKSGKGIVEFLKRVYSPLGELTPYPLNSALASFSDISNTLALQDLLVKTNWPEPVLAHTLSYLPLTGKKEILIGAPMIQFGTEVPKQVSQGNTDTWEALAQNLTLR